FCLHSLRTFRCTPIQIRSPSFDTSTRLTKCTYSGTTKEEIPNFGRLHLEAHFVFAHAPSPLEIAYAVPIENNARQRKRIGADEGVPTTAACKEGSHHRDEEMGYEVFSSAIVSENRRGGVSHCSNVHGAAAHWRYNRNGDKI